MLAILLNSKVQVIAISEVQPILQLHKWMK